jgi:hypothetical protein
VINAQHLSLQIMEWNSTIARILKRHLLPLLTEELQSSPAVAQLVASGAKTRDAPWPGCLTHWGTLTTMPLFKLCQELTGKG